MDQRGFSNDPATERFLAQTDKPPEPGETEEDVYPRHWLANASHLTQRLADLSDEDLLTTLNAALARRQQK